MKPKQTLAEAQDQLFGSIRAFAEQLIANAYSRYNPDEGDFSIALALEKKPESDTAAGKKRNFAGNFKLRVGIYRVIYTYKKNLLIVQSIHKTGENTNARYTPTHQPPDP